METDNGVGIGYEHIMKIWFALELYTSNSALHGKTF